MNYNPYAAPQAGPAQGDPGQQGPGAPQPWEIGEVLTAAWAGFTEHWTVLLPALLVVGLVVGVPVVGLFGGLSAAGYRAGGNEMQGAQVLMTLIALVGTAFFQTGLLRITLVVARGQRPEFGTLFSGGDRFVNMLVLRALLQAPGLIISSLAVAAGFLGLGILGMVLGFVNGAVTLAVQLVTALGVYYADFFIVEENLSAIEAIKAAWARTGDERGKIFLMALAAFFITVGASMCCFLPVFAAVPTVMIAGAIVFLRITGRGAAAPHATMQSGGPPGYGGPPGPGGGGYGGPPGGGGYGGPPGGGGYGGPPGGGGYGPPPGYGPPR